MNLDRDILEDSVPSTFTEALQFSSNDGGNNKLPIYDLQLLCAWYDKLSELGPRQLVVILSDFESFDSNLLARFLTILNSYYPRLPIVLVINLATTMDSFTMSLPNSVLRCLKTCQFALNPSNEIMNVLVEKLFLESTSGLKLNFECMEYLLQQYQLYDLSVSKFISCLKYAVMDHYSNHPLCLLVDTQEDIESPVNDEIVSLLQTWHFDMIRSLPCFQE